MDNQALTQYMNRAIRQLVQDVFKNTLNNPLETAFLLLFWHPVCPAGWRRAADSPGCTGGGRTVRIDPVSGFQQRYPDRSGVLRLFGQTPQPGARSQHGGRAGLDGTAARTGHVRHAAWESDQLVSCRAAEPAWLPPVFLSSMCPPTRSERFG